MENDIEKLKFPIGKYKAILEFNFSRTVEDIKTLEIGQFFLLTQNQNKLFLKSMLNHYLKIYF